MQTIRTDRPAGEALRRLARKTLAALAADLDRAAATGGVHGARKRLKFMRSLLRLMKPAIGKASFRKADRRLRAAAHAIAGARRAEAMQETVAKLRPRNRPDSPVLAELARLASSAHGHEAAPAALLEAAAEARRNIEKLRGTINDWRLPKRNVAPFVAGLRRAYAAARGKLRSGLAARDIARLHAARKSVIHHLHHLETLAPLWPEPIRQRTRELTRLRTALGDLNDLEELERLVVADAGDCQAARGVIAARRARLLARSRRQAQRLFTEKPAAFAGRVAAMWREVAA